MATANQEETKEVAVAATEAGVDEAAVVVVVDAAVAGDNDQREPSWCERF